DGFQDFGWRRAGFKAALGGELIYEAVGEWVAERNAELEHVYAGLVKGEAELAGGFEGGVARADIDDEALFAFALQLRKTFHNAIHAAWSFGCWGLGFKFGVPDRSSPSPQPSPPPGEGETHCRRRILRAHLALSNVENVRYYFVACACQVSRRPS